MSFINASIETTHEWSSIELGSANATSTPPPRSSRHRIVAHRSKVSMSMLMLISIQGADEHVDYTSTPNLRSAIQAFNPDAVIDCVGGTTCVGLPSSKRYITIVGDKTGRTSMGGPYTYYNILSWHAPFQWLRWAKGQLGVGESYDVVILQMKKEWLEEAKETLTPDQIFVDSEFAFDDALKAFERLNTGRARGKVVVNIS
jgi:reticulon-4-interacting protein 1, mitochondrial